jgi:hypothetical protein
MAKNFYGLKDGYQATYILENVIQISLIFSEGCRCSKKNWTELNGRIQNEFIHY